MSSEYFIPLRSLLSTWPDDQVFVSDGESLLDRIGISDFTINETDTQTTVALTIVIDAEVAVSLPGLSGFEVAVCADTGRTVIDVAVDLRAPFEIRITGVTVELRLPAGALVPAVLGTDGYEPDPAVSRVAIRTSATIRIDGEGNVSVEPDGTIGLDPVLIGETGVAVVASVIALDLSPSASCAAAEAAGIDAERTGVFIESASVHLPSALDLGLPSTLTLTNCYIGTGGLDGSLTASFDPGDAEGTAAGFSFQTLEVGVAFTAGALSAGRVRGLLTLPFFDKDITVDVAVAADGSIGLQLSVDQTADGVSYDADTGLVDVTLEGLVTISIRSIGITIAGEGSWSVTIGGTLQLEIAGYDWPELTVDALSIASDGTLNIEGGWIDLPEKSGLDLGGFTVEISQIGFGKEDDRSWIGLSGGLLLGTGIEAGASVEGLRLSWPTSATTDAERVAGLQVSLDGVGVTVGVAGVVQAEGKVSWSNDDGRSEFTGELELALESLGLGIDIGILVGRNEVAQSYTYAYLSVALDLPVGIPILNTGLAIYGGELVVGVNIEPGRTGDTSWRDWYEASPMGVDDPNKWSDRSGAYVVGLGLSMGTLPDLGFAFSSRALCLVLVPGPTILLEGRAAFLRARTGLADDAPLNLLAVLDFDSGEFLLAMNAQWQIDETSGLILSTVSGSEARFSLSDPADWYVHIGEESPMDRRSRATIVSLFEADSYLLIDGSGIVTGCHVGYEMHFSFGPVSLDIVAAIDGYAAISWVPAQLEATFSVEGDIRINAFGVGASLSVLADMAVASPDPVEIDMLLSVEMQMPWPVPDIDVEAEFHFSIAGTPPVPMVLRTSGVEHLKVSETWPVTQVPAYDTDADGYRNTAAPSAHSESAALAACPIVPMDARPTFTFRGPLHDEAKVASNTAPATSGVEVAGTFQRYALTGVRVEQRARGSGSFTVVAERDRSGTVTGTLYGYWQVDTSPEAQQTRLMLWGENSFEIARSSLTGAYGEAVRAVNPHYPCIDAPDPWFRADVDAYATGTDRSNQTFPMDATTATTAGTWSVVNQPDVTLGTQQALANASVAGGNVTVTLGVSADQVEVYATISPGAGGLIEILDGATVVDSATLPGPYPAVFSVSSATSVRLTGQTVRLVGIRYRDAALAALSTEILAARASLQSEMETRAAETDYVLLPDSYYRITITTAVQTASAADGPFTDSATYTEYAYFQTEAPPGCSTTAGADGGYPLEGVLTDLARYVESTVPEDGAVVAYRAYDVSFVFNENYVELMYDLAGTSLEIEIMDQDGQPVLDSSGLPVTLTQSFSKVSEATPTMSESLWRAFVSASDCLSWDNGWLIGDDACSASTDGQPLRPRTRYVATLTCSAAVIPLATTTFATSAYVCFAEHIQAGYGDLWTVEGTVTVDVTALEVAVAAAAALNLADDDACRDAWGTVAPLVLGDERTDLPQRIDLSRVVDPSNQAWALLLESPEPIPLERVALVATRATPTPTTQRALGAARITACRMSAADRAAADPNSEWVEIIAREAGTLEGMVIGAVGVVEGDSVATTIYTFGAGATVGEGDVVRLYMGTGSSHTPPEGITAYYVGGSSFLFQAAGDRVLLLDADGARLDGIPVLDEALFTALEAVVVPNSDRTRVLLFFPSSSGSLTGSLSAGHYRLDLTHAAAPGGDLAALSRGGVASDEWTRLQCTINA